MQLGARINKHYFMGIRPSHIQSMGQKIFSPDNIKAVQTLYNTTQDLKKMHSSLEKH